MKKLLEEIQDTIDTLKWSFLITLIAFGVAAVIVTGIIFMYLFMIVAHAKSFFGNVFGFFTRK